MSDWKSRATDVTHLYSQKNEKEVNSDNTIAEPVSKIESLLRGAAQGATLGFADELTGGGEALLDQLKGSDDSLIDSYREHRDESRAAYKAAEEENPLTYLGGNMLGGVALPIPLGGAKTVGQAAMTAAKLGAIGGLGTSDANNAADMVREVGSGALLGGAMGGTMHGLGRLGKLLSKTDAARALQEGKAGVNLVGKEARQQIGEQLGNVASDIGEQVKTKAEEQAKNKINALKQADKSGQIVDVKEFLNNLLNPIQELPEALTSAQEQSRNLYKEPIENLQKIIKESGEAKPSQIEKLRKTMSELGYDKNLSEPEMQALAKQASGKTGELVNKEIPDLQKINENLQNLMDAQHIFNSGEGVDALGNKIKVSPLLQGLESESMASDLARAKFKEGINAINKVDPNMAKQIESQGSNIAERYDLARNINNPISFTGNPVEMASRISGRTANLMGQGVNKASNTIPGKIISTTFNAAPEYINSLAAQLEAKNSKFAPLLRNIANEPEPKRKALMFALMQQPAFRESFKMFSGDEE